MGCGASQEHVVHPPLDQQQQQPQLQQHLPDGSAAGSPSPGQVIKHDQQHRESTSASHLGALTIAVRSPSFLAEMAALLKNYQQSDALDALHAMFKRVMDTLCNALREQAPDMLELLLQRLLPALVAVREPLTVSALARVVAGQDGQHSSCEADSMEKQVSQLVGLLEPLFHESSAEEGSSGEPCVVPHHRTVMDWLRLSTEGSYGPQHMYHIDEAAGHVLLATACSNELLASSVPVANLFLPNAHPVLDQQQHPSPLRCYALRQAVAHACQCHDSPGLLSALVYDLRAWHAIVLAGHGPSALEDLLQSLATMPQAMADTTYDLIRWLRSTPSMLASTDGHELLVSALQCPITTPVFCAAQSIAVTMRPPFTQLPTLAAAAWTHWPSLEVAMKGHDGAVMSVAYSPNGRLLASGGADMTLRLWCPFTAQCLRVLRGHKGTVNSVSFSPDGLRLVSGSADETVCIWDADTAQCAAQAQGHSGAVNGVQFSPNGRHVASGGADGTLRIWSADVSQTSVVMEVGKAVCSVSWSPDGGRVATASHDVVHIWNISTAQQEATLKAHCGFVFHAAFSPAGTHVVSGSDDSLVAVSEATTGETVCKMQKHRSAVNCAAFSPDGSRVVSVCSGGTLRLWAAGSWECSDTLISGCELHSVAFSPDGQRLASAGADGRVCLWNARAKVQSQGPSQTRRVTGVAFSPSQRIVATTGDNQLCLWNADSGQHVASLARKSFCNVVFSADGNRIAVAGSDAGVWDVSAQKCVTALKGPTQGFLSIVLSPDSSRIATGGKDGLVRLWHGTTGYCLAGLEGCSGAVNSLAWPSRDLLVSGSADGSLRTWDLVTGQCAQAWQTGGGPVNGVACSHDGRWIACANTDATVSLRNASNTAGESRTLQGQGVMRCVAFSPGGAHVLAGNDGGTVRIWQVSTGQCVAVLHGHRSFVLSVAVSWDGTRIATASDDASWRLWEAALEGRVVFGPAPVPDTAPPPSSSSVQHVAAATVALDAPVPADCQAVTAPANAAATAADADVRCTANRWLQAEPHARVDVRQRGVRLSYLHLLISSGAVDPEWTIQQVVDKFIVPSSVAFKCCLFDLVPHEYTGTPRWFISHTWSRSLGSTLELLVRHFDDAGAGEEAPVVWLDIFAINQHPYGDKGALLEDDVANLAKVVASTEQTLLCLDEDCQALTRVWCLFEVWQTFIQKGTEGLLVITTNLDLATLRHTMANFDVEKAQATQPEDRERIIRQIRGNVGVSLFNTDIKHALVQSTVHAANVNTVARGAARGRLLMKAGLMIAAQGHGGDAGEPSFMECMNSKSYPFFKEASKLMEEELGADHPETRKCYQAYDASTQAPKVLTGPPLVSFVGMARQLDAFFRVTRS